jgi:hypothetical protein
MSLVIFLHAEDHYCVMLYLIVCYVGSTVLEKLLKCFIFLPN